MIPGDITAGEWHDRAPAARAGCQAVTFEFIYDSLFEDVRRWVRAFGAPDADIDDLAQEVFIVVHRRLAHFDGRNLRGWVYQITRRQVRDFRRLRWFRLLLRSRSPDLSLPSGDRADAPLEQRESRAALERMLAKLPEANRVTFVLFELEGYSGEEIADLHEVSVNTVWARLHKARRALVAQVERALAAKARRGSP